MFIYSILALPNFLFTGNVIIHLNCFCMTYKLQFIHSTQGEKKFCSDDLYGISCRNRIMSFCSLSHCTGDKLPYFAKSVWAFVIVLHSESGYSSTSQAMFYNDVQLKGTIKNLCVWWMAAPYSEISLKLVKFTLWTSITVKSIHIWLPGTAWKHVYELNYPPSYSLLNKHNLLNIKHSIVRNIY